MSMNIPQFDSNASQEEVIQALREAGCAVITRLASEALLDRISDELAPHFQKGGFGVSEGTGLRTQRICRIPIKSRASHELIMHPFTLGVIEEILRTEAYFVTLHHCEASRMHPGETIQFVHRDISTYPFKHPCPPLQYITAWAFNHFTRENGATHVVPGSHLWDDERKPTASELVPAEMPKGSVLIFDSALYHCGGANTTEDEIRASMLLNYGVGWLRPFENPTLSVPPEHAKTMSKKMQELLGYRSHGYLGHFEFHGPEIVLQDEIPEIISRPDLFAEIEQVKVRKR